MFEFPKIHSFPPFYTKQRNATILENQLDAWGALVLDYCEHYRIFSVLENGSVLAQQESHDMPDLFENKAIERAVLDDFKKDILAHLVTKLARAAYVDPKKRDAGVLLYWRTPAEWAALLREHVDSTGQLGTILTVYELTKLEEAAPQFRNMDYQLLVRAIEVLMKQGRAQVLKAEDGSGQIGGVKIV